MTRQHAISLKNGGGMELKEQIKKMSRSGKIEKRQVNPDSIYGSILVAKFINRLMRHGKKTTAQRVFYGALESIKKKTDKDPLEIFETAVKKIRFSLIGLMFF